MYKVAIVYKNFFDYDPVVKPPSESLNRTVLPPDTFEIDFWYVCNTDTSAQQAKDLGWNVHQTRQFDGVQSPKGKRDVVAYINAYPDVAIPQLKDLSYTHVMICDSNVQAFDPAYSDYVAQACASGKAMFLSSGAYVGSKDTIHEELLRSVTVTRWAYDHEKMRARWNHYANVLRNKDINYNNIPVVSAKYIGCSLQHPLRKVISDYLYTEYIEHLQGNIICSMILALWSEDVFHFRHGFDATKLTDHTVYNY